ncbi:hypothetical protein [Anaerovibrio sp.]|uniref:hypothetical protein n=1 Tax=Anaerovibrio sp. TaxID=1872532 RepID=UPI003F174292
MKGRGNIGPGGGRSGPPAGHGWLDAALNFLLSFGVAVVWLGRWTIRLASGLWQRWKR